jgi:hypothetical protein
MKDVTLITVGWKQMSAVELMLKSYLATHYAGEKLNAIIWDNNESDALFAFCKEHDIPLKSLERKLFEVSNIGHENGINNLYVEVKTKYCLLADTDIKFTESLEPYLELLKGDCVAVGEQVGELTAAWGTIRPRLGAWMILFDIEKCREAGIKIFRDPTVTDWSYDVGSWFFEQILKAGFTYYNIQRKTDHFDPIAVYDKFVHYGGISWDMSRPEHSNRIREIKDKYDLIQKTLAEYNYIDLNSKFTI